MVKLIIRKSELLSEGEGDSDADQSSSEPEETKEFGCQLCAFTTTVEGDLKTHHELKHLGEDGKLHCTECDFSCKRNEVMKKHMEAQHPPTTKSSSENSNEKNGKSGSPAPEPQDSIRPANTQLYTCEQCFKAFHSRFVLKTHIKAHRKLKESQKDGGKIDKYYLYYLYSAA